MDLAALSQLGDCEAVGEGWLKQDAWSSLAFSAVGVGVVLSAVAVTDRERVDRIVFGVMLVATGIGSFLYHGPRPGTGRFLHDVSFLAALWYLTVANLTGALALPGRAALLAVIAGPALVAAVLVVDPDLTNLFTAAFGVALVASDVVLRRVAPPSPVWYAIAVSALIVGIGLFLAGRSGSPLCDPDGLLQAHAGWHAAAAIAFGAYFFATEPARTRAEPA